MGSGTIYASSDFGNTWSTTTVASNYWESICCSADGKYLAAAANSDNLNNTVPGQIHLSQDWGLHWHTPSDPGSNYWHFWLSIASSSDGSKLVAVNAEGTIYTSLDFGDTWTLTGAPGENWFSVASSTNGNNLVAVANNGPIYTSTNSGVSWNEAANAPVAGWASVASSSDGMKLAAVQWGGALYTSEDCGNNWIENNFPNTFAAGGIWGIATTADGDKILTAGDGPWGGPVYILQPQPILNIESTTISHGNANISWPASAGGFILQNTSSLGLDNWVNTTNQIEYTNAQYQIILSPSNGVEFFRLNFPSGSPPWWWPGRPPPIFFL